MKWYFALNEESLASSPSLWEPMITAAVSSALTNTDLDPHLIYDGAWLPFLSVLESWGVKVVRHRVSFYEALARHKSGDPSYLRIASGAFLRTEIPLIEADEYVLYTDCDVIFHSAISIETLFSEPFSCGPEFDKSNFALFNTGVMMMNIKVLKDRHSEFREFITGSLDKFDTFDQDAYRQFYGAEIRRLNLAYNWKPYWGVSRDAAIIHFHGPKPSYAAHLLENPSDMTSPPLNEIFHWNVDGYRHYLPLWQAAAAKQPKRRVVA